MNAFSQAQRAYSPAASPTRTARSAEYEVIARISHRMKKAIKTGDFLSAKIERPFNHVGEADRWDLRVTVVWKNALMAFGLDDFDMEAFNRKLYPDQERWKKEEQRRFELIDEHMDVQVYEVDPASYSN